MRKTIITSDQSDFAKMQIKNGYNYREISETLNLGQVLIKNHLNKRGYFLLNFKIKIINCLNCGKEAKKIEYVDGKKIIREKYCSKVCSNEYCHTHKKGKYKNRKERKKCLNCDNDCKRLASVYCNQKCQFEYMDKILIERVKNNETKGLSSVVVKKALIIIHGEKCMKCGWDEKNVVTGKVPIELNHKDGNSEDNDTGNVELICPNCHSLTYNYKALNKGKGRHKRRQRARDGKSY